jgi:hypothetical protein
MRLTSPASPERRPPEIAKARRIAACWLAIALVVSALAVSFHHHPLTASGSEDLRCGLCNLARAGGLTPEPADAGLAPDQPVGRATAPRDGIISAQERWSSRITRAPPAIPSFC